MEAKTQQPISLDQLFNLESEVIANMMTDTAAHGIGGNWKEVVDRLTEMITNRVMATLALAESASKHGVMICNGSKFVLHYEELESRLGEVPEEGTIFDLDIAFGGAEFTCKFVSLGVAFDDHVEIREARPGDQERHDRLMRILGKSDERKREKPE